MAVVVLGMHRSGTSLVVGLLGQHGFHLGDVSRQTSPLKPTGTQEHLLVREINNRLLQEAGGSWQQPVVVEHVSGPTQTKMQAVTDELSHHRNWAVKDPRMVLTYAAWRPWLPPHQTLYCVRSASAVAASLQQKNQLPLAAGMALWEAYNRQLLWLLRRFPGPLIEFTDQATVTRQFAAACDSLGMVHKPSLVESFYVQRDDRDRPTTPADSASQQSLYQAILDAASGGHGV